MPTALALHTCRTRLFERKVERGDGRVGGEGRGGGYFGGYEPVGEVRDVEHGPRVRSHMGCTQRDIIFSPQKFFHLFSSGGAGKHARGGKKNSAGNWGHRARSHLCWPPSVGPHDDKDARLRKGRAGPSFLPHRRPSACGLLQSCASPVRVDGQTRPCCNLTTRFLSPVFLWARALSSVYNFTSARNRQK